jgi:hypothetical protein
VRAQRAAAIVADLAVAGLYVPAGPGPEPVGGLLRGPAVGRRLRRAARRRRCGARHNGRQQDAAAPGCRTRLSLERLGPASVLARLDRFMERGGEEAFATLWYGEYRPSIGTLTYASAGHPPPAVHTHSGVTLLAEADAPSLGIGLAHTLAIERVAHLPPGAVLVAYNDGLIERRGADLDRQLAQLAEVVRRACDPGRTGTAQSIAAEILDALVSDPHRAEDDVSLLVARRQPPPINSLAPPAARLLCPGTRPLGLRPLTQSVCGQRLRGRLGRLCAQPPEPRCPGRRAPPMHRAQRGPRHEMSDTRPARLCTVSRWPTRCRRWSAPPLFTSWVRSPRVAVCVHGSADRSPRAARVGSSPWISR